MLRYRSRIFHGAANEKLCGRERLWVQVIARIQNDFSEKFGIPRQCGLVPALQARIVFEPAYRNPAAVKGLEDY